MPENKSEVCNVIWLLLWNGIVCVRRSRLAKAVPVRKISQRELHECIQQTLFISIPHQQNLVAHAPILIIVSRIEWCLYKKKHGPVAVQKQSQ